MFPNGYQAVLLSWNKAVVDVIVHHSSLIRRIAQHRKILRLYRGCHLLKYDVKECLAPLSVCSQHDMLGFDVTVSDSGLACHEPIDF
jgi:hypothetical protein